MRPGTLSMKRSELRQPLPEPLPLLIIFDLDYSSQQRPMQSTQKAGVRIVLFLADFNDVAQSL